MIAARTIDHWVMFHEERIYNLGNLDLIEKCDDDKICLKSGNSVYYIKYQSKERRDENFEVIRRTLMARKLFP